MIGNEKQIQIYNQSRIKIQQTNQSIHSLMKNPSNTFYRTKHNYDEDVQLRFSIKL